MTLEPAFGDGANKAAAGGDVDMGRRGMLLAAIVSYTSKRSGIFQGKGYVPSGGQCTIQVLHCEKVKALDLRRAACGPCGGGKVARKTQIYTASILTSGIL